MKILHVFHRSNLKNGVDKTTCTLISALKKLGATTVAVVPALGEVTTFLAANDVPYKIIPYSCCGSDAWRAQFRFLADSSSQIEKIVCFIKQQQPDVIHLNTGHLLHAALAAAQCKIPTIWHIHAPFDNDLKRYQKAIGEGGYRWILENLSSQVIGVSNDVMDTISKQISPERVKTLYNGIDVEALQATALASATNIRNELNLPSDAKIILGVGRISAHKDFASFARVASMVSKTNNKLFFVIAGPKEGLEAIKLLDAEIQRLNLVGILFILGPRSDVPALITQSDAFLSTAISEGQGIAALEAMAFKKPVVAMACQGLRECIQDNIDGLLIEPGDEPAAATALLKVLDDASLSKKLGEKGLESVKAKFSSEIYGQDFLDIAKTAVETGPARASSDALAMVNGLLSEINTAHHRLLTVENQSIMQRLRLLLWHLFH